MCATRNNLVRHVHELRSPLAAVSYSLTLSPSSSLCTGGRVMPAAKTEGANGQVMHQLGRGESTHAALHRPCLSKGARAQRYCSDRIRE